MTRDEQRLVRHLVMAVTVKLAVLAALWWWFVREVQVPVDADRTAAQIGAQGSSPAPPTGVRP